MKPYELAERLEKIGIDHRDVRRVCWYTVVEFHRRWWDNRWEVYYEYCIELYEPVNNCHFMTVREQNWTKAVIHYYKDEPKKPVEPRHKTKEPKREPRIKRVKKHKKGYGRRHLRDEDDD